MKLTYETLVSRIQNLVKRADDPWGKGPSVLPMLRQLQCEHNGQWKTYDGPSNSWVLGGKDENATGGCYCADCGMSILEAANQ